jgi:hypothetical protein
LLNKLAPTAVQSLASTQLTPKNSPVVPVTGTSTPFVEGTLARKGAVTLLSTPTAVQLDPLKQLTAVK